MQGAFVSAEDGRRLGLRVDACTLRGAVSGVLPLVKELERLGVHASFFVALGPDCSGRALARVVRRPGFLSKMLRTRGLSMYGLRTALYGTVLPPPRIGRRAGDILRRVHREGHEIGLHSWDHVRWQDRLDSLSREQIAEDYDRAAACFHDAVGVEPRVSAAPAWLCSPASLAIAAEREFRYTSDTRGRCPFVPRLPAENRVASGLQCVPQIPVTLPTLDEVLGSNGATADDFYAGVEAKLGGGGTQVLTVHAEAEGRAFLRPFVAFLERVLAAGVSVSPLGELIADAGGLPSCGVERGQVDGRAGEVSLQGA